MNLSNLERSTVFNFEKTSATFETSKMHNIYFIKDIFKQKLETIRPNMKFINFV